MRYIFSMFFTLSTMALCALSSEQRILGTHLEDQITISSELPQENTILPVSELECRRHHLHNLKDHGCHENNKREVVYGSFSTTETVEVLAGSAIPFSTTSAISKNGIQLAAGGQILISQPGDYFINFGASVFTQAALTPNLISTLSNQIALSLDGVYPQPGSNISIANFGISAGYLTSASTILHIENALPEQPAVLSVVNNSTVVGSILPLGVSTVQDVVAYITIDKLNDLTTQSVNK